MRIIRRGMCAGVLSGLLVVAGLGLSAETLAGDRAYSGMYGSQRGYFGYQSDGAFVDSSEPDEVDMLLDAFLVRPVMAGYTLVSTAGFVLSLPLTLLSGDTGQVAHDWVYRPFRYTLRRDLGDMRDPPVRRFAAQEVADSSP